MGLVDHHDVGELGDPAESLREVALAAEVRVAEDRKVAEVGVPADATDVRQPLAQVRLPHALFRRLGSEQHHALAFVQHQPLDKHQAHEGLAEANAVAEEGATVLARDLHERPVRLLLVAVDPGKHLRAGLVPLGRGQLVPAEELLQRLRVDVERRVEMRVARDGLDDGVGHLARVVPVLFEPLLELRDLAGALDLDVELDVLGQARSGEVARSHQRLRADHFELGVRDVCLGVELVVVVDAALDLPRSERLEDRRNAMEEGVGFLVGLDALVEDLHGARAHRLEERFARAMRRLRAHQNPDLLQRLPLPVEGEQGTDLEVPRGDIERLGNAGPLLEVAEPSPARDAVVDDE